MIKPYAKPISTEIRIYFGKNKALFSYYLSPDEDYTERLIATKDAMAGYLSDPDFSENLDYDTIEQELVKYEQLNNVSKEVFNPLPYLRPALSIMGDDKTYHSYYINGQPAIHNKVSAFSTSKASGRAVEAFKMNTQTGMIKKATSTQLAAFDKALKKEDALFSNYFYKGKIVKLGAARVLASIPPVPEDYEIPARGRRYSW